MKRVIAHAEHGDKFTTLTFSVPRLPEDPNFLLRITEMVGIPEGYSVLVGNGVVKKGDRYWDGNRWIKVSPFHLHWTIEESNNVYIRKNEDETK